ncbi:MAG: indole-3-glycerol phosphate synthase [Candidatus Methanogaster sp.]|uniref:Indole-3-glycerol phosphate synthase n=1 Tax=Candidatus Methanogaster sp. TaxID=3386292 RepID=A0AC61KZ51_9EURY|nr:MAG: indole-3-glycerol phosphate synthase [ANME-2 cluster archaeon]
MHKVIDDILTSTRQRVADLHAADTGAPKKIDHRDIIPLIRLRKRENRIPVIAEVKPGSPTTDKREITPDDAARIAQEMEAAGAVAISVLTEPEFFGGSIENLSAVRRAVSIPVLRKDFIIDEKQIYETESDLILLIAGILGNDLEQFIDLSITRGIEPLVEVHDRAELADALNTEARIIGVNNRNLNTLTVDLSTSEHLIPSIPDSRIIISESGTQGPLDAVRMIRVGADAILVGTAVMDAPFDKTSELVDAL